MNKMEINAVGVIFIVTDTWLTRVHVNVAGSGEAEMS